MFVKSTRFKQVCQLLLSLIVELKSLDIYSGKFQSGPLPILLFCIALAPLSSLLNSNSYGYTTGTSAINHLFYMDDLKTFGNKNARKNVKSRLLRD